MSRQLVAVALAGTVLLWMALGWSAHGGRRGRTGPAVQAIGGLVCGLLAAVVVAVPHVDVVPDEDEAAVEILVAVAVITAGALAILRWRWRRSVVEQASQPGSGSVLDQPIAQRAVGARRSQRET
ncbi:MAG: hypothetical protein ABI239_10560 [Aquihabitans sp.]